MEIKTKKWIGGFVENMVDAEEKVIIFSFGVMATLFILFVGHLIRIEPANIVYHRPAATEVWQALKAEVTAYSSSEDETDDTPFLTASGEEAKDGVIACPARLEFGTVIKIEGKEYVCLDRMNKRYRETDRFDIWMPSKKEAVEFGIKQLTIEVKQ